MPRWLGAKAQSRRIENSQSSPKCGWSSGPTIGPCSRQTTFAPAFVSTWAMAAPAMPAPTTMTSGWSIRDMVHLFGGDEGATLGRRDQQLLGLGVAEGLGCPVVAVAAVDHRREHASRGVVAVVDELAEEHE